MNAPSGARVQSVPQEGYPQRGELLRVLHLTHHFPITAGAVFRREVARVHAIDDVSFVINEGETLALVGESGSGKSTVIRCVLRLVEPSAGRILFRSKDLTAASPKELRSLRREIQVIFQDPFASLNPRMTVGESIAEPLLVHNIPRGTTTVGDLLEQVGLDRRDEGRYPHEFSGGQRQRIAVARAIATRPSLVLCDEPVSSLDVSIRGQILNLLGDLQKDFAIAYLLVSHDLAVVRDVADRVAVMYAGKIVELGSTEVLYARPRHPYTVALLSAVPVPVPSTGGSRGVVLRGEIPDPARPPSGCRFHTRCWKAQAICRDAEPPLEEVAPGHWAACHFPEGGERPWKG